VYALIEAAREQRLLPQGCEEQNDTDGDYAHAAHDNPCGHRVSSSLSPVQLSRGWRRKARRAASHNRGPVFAGWWG
jgi:hypothetical protein